MAETKQLFNAPRCQHVHYSGKPCKAPARRGRNYCVFHQAAHLDPGGCVLPIIEDLHSYQLAIIRIARALADDVIDSRKATALLYALQLAGSKLEAFAKQRAEIERPAVALKNEITERYDARRYPFPLHVPEKDLVVILQEITREQPAEPNDALAPIPQKPPVAAHPDPVPDTRVEASETSTSAFRHEPCDLSPAPERIDPSPDLRPPQDDIGLNAQGAA